MSDDKPTDPVPPSDTTATPTPTPRPAEKKKKTRAQRFKILGLIALILMIGFRALLGVLLPTVVRKVSNSFDLDCTYDKMSLGLLGGNAQIWGLNLKPKAGGESIVHADFILGSIDTLALFKGKLNVYRAEVDGVDVVIDREADGSIPLLKTLLPKPGATATPAKTTGAATQPINLQSPLRVDAVRVSHVRTRFRDKSVTPMFDASINTSVRISNVGSASEPAHFELDVAGDPILDDLIVRGEAHNTPTTIDADLSLIVRGLHLKPAAGYLARLGLRPTADGMNFTADLKLTASPVANTSDVAAKLSLANISARSDNSEFAHLAHLTVDARALGAAAVQVDAITIDGGGIAASRSNKGLLQLGGIELDPTLAVGDTTPATVPTTNPAAPAATLPRIALAQLNLKNLQAAVRDDFVSPSANFVARVDDMAITNVVLDPAEPNAEAKLVGTLSLPGLVKSVHVDGTAAPFAPDKSLQLTVQAAGVSPTELQPYLDALGIQSQLNNAAFTAALKANFSPGANGAVSANLWFTDIALKDEAELIALKSAAVTGVLIDPASHSISVDAIDLSGPALALKHDKTGGISGVGFRYAPGEPSKSVAVQAAATTLPTTKPAPATPPIFSRFALNKFTWHDSAIRVTDESAPNDPVTLVGRAGVEAADLAIDLNATQLGKPGTFHAWLAVPLTLDRAEISGTVTPAPRGATIDATVFATGISGESLKPYLTPLGVVPTLTNGELKLKAAATVALDDNVLQTSAKFTDVTYVDDKTELAGVDAVQIDGVSLSPKKVSIQDIEIARPRMRASRNVAGEFETLGMRLAATRPAPATAPTIAIAPQPTTSPAPFSLPASPIDALIQKLHVADATLDWTDAAPAKPVHTSLVTTVTLTNASVGANAKPATLDVAAKVKDVIDGATVRGTLDLSPDHPAAKLDIAANGVRAGALTPYLPRGIETTLKDGRLAASIDVGASNNAAGGLAAHFIASNVNLHDADAPPLLKVERLHLSASRIDPAGGVIAVDEISSAGVESSVRMTREGAIEAVGLQIMKVAQPAPVVVEATTPVMSATQPVVDVRAAVAEARKALPLVTVDKLDLRLARFTVAGATGPGATPVELKDVQLRNDGRIEIGGEDAESKSPVKISVTGGVDPVVGHFAVDVKAAPLAMPATVVVDVSATGIDGTGITGVMPALAKTLDGSALKAGVFTTHFEASANLARHGPHEVDLTKPFTVDFDVKPLSYRAEPEGPILAGVDEVRSEGIKVDPKTGDVIVKLLEISKPIGHATRDAAGIHAGGFLVPTTAQNAGTEAADSAPANPSTTAPSTPSAASATASVPPKNEIRLDRLTVSGVDVRVEDHTSKPPTVIALNGLDVDVRDVSNQTPFNGKPMRFSVLATSDKVPLPYRRGSATPTTTSSESSTQPTLQNRELFSQFTANGKVAVKQTGSRFALDGWAKTSVDGFELLGVRGLAEPFKVNIGGGIVDDSNDIRFTPDGKIETRNKVVFTNLSLTEPPNGPIQSALKLSGPIDAVILAIEDPDGSITATPPVKIVNGAVSKDELLAPVIFEVAKMVGTGVASTPLKVVNGVGDIFGLGKKEIIPAPAVVHFLPGYPVPDAGDDADLRAVIEFLGRHPDASVQVKHDLSAADIARAAVRANPSRDDCLALATNLRAQRADFASQRESLSAAAAAMLSSAPGSAAETSVSSLRALDRRIAQTDRALDQLYDLLKPGSDRYADRRTRAAALEIARERLEAVKQILLAANLPNAKDRVKILNPQFAPADSPAYAPIGDTLIGGTAAGGTVTTTLVPKKQ